MKTVLEIGKWYKSDKFLCFYKSEYHLVGFNSHGNWVDPCFWLGGTNYYWTLATEEEVKKALSEEAKKRGYKVGCKLNRSHFPYNKRKDTISGNDLHYNNFMLQMGGSSIYEDGQWAEIIHTPNTSEIEPIQPNDFKQLKEKINHIIINGQPNDQVNNPKHYGNGENDPYEVIKVIEDWKLDFILGNTVKYIARAEKKGNKLQDLKKAQWYLNRIITKLEN